MTERPLAGTVVVELGAWIAGPSATALLSDWGAEVWKIEPPGGDPFRQIIASQGYNSDIGNAPFTVDNRGKRSVVLNLRDDTAVEVLHRILTHADIFLTNLRVSALERLNLTYESLSVRHPHLVYCLLTGYGSTGPDRNRPGYDVGAFGARTGVLHQLRAGSSPPGPLPLGFGDHVVALSAAAGALAALVQRGRTGKGQLVETSLLRSGVFALGWETGVQLLLGRVPGTAARTETKTPLFNCYRSADDRWFWLVGVEADRHFGSVVAAIDRPELLTDPRFESARQRRRNARDFIAELDSAFATRPLEEWSERFALQRVWWEPVLTPAEVVEDPQTRAAGCVVDVDGEDFSTVAGPVDFNGHREQRVRPAPPLGADTTDVLRRVGCPDDLIDRMVVNAGSAERGGTSIPT